MYYLATTVTRLSVGRIVGRIRKSTLVIISIGLAALFSFALAISVDDFAFAGIFALIGAIQGLIFPIGSMLIADHIQPSRNVLANSLYVMGLDFGQGMVPLITASLVIQYGLEYSFMVAAAISAAATLLIIWLTMHKLP